MDIAWIQRRVDDHEASDQRIAQRLNAMSRHVDATVSLVRRVATELRPAVLDNLGLVPALDLLLRQFNERMGIGVEPSLDAPVDLTPTQATALYRIAQEALTNVARHAQARRVWLRMDHSGGSARLERTTRTGGSSGGINPPTPWPRVDLVLLDCGASHSEGLEWLRGAPASPKRPPIIALICARRGRARLLSPHSKLRRSRAQAHTMTGGPSGT